VALSLGLPVCPVRGVIGPSGWHSHEQQTQANKGRQADNLHLVTPVGLTAWHPSCGSINETPRPASGSRPNSCNSAMFFVPDQPFTVSSGSAGHLNAEVAKDAEGLIGSQKRRS